MATARKYRLNEYLISNRLFILNLRAVSLVLLWAATAAFIFLLYRGVTT